ncbi:alpha/beta hydrolase [Acidicapsa acidisoli]|uniref:alpha/beta hydrolase n=1 Tax=Acidicapsa acidisoli TaxID=1615681 RepID=UPI0021E047AB|nr:alpha/beta family hydrolase [Acidicapsa acidisoli]
MPASADKSVFPRPPLTSATPEAPKVPASLRSFDLCGPAGRLEALLNEGHPSAPFATLLCHPHPLGGGTMHNKVVYHAMKVFNGLGWPVLRFNFRGTGLSEGSHDGRAEADDVRAGLDWLSREYGKPIVAAGFSFGAAMGLNACCGHPGISGFAALGLPTHAEGRDYKYPFLPSCNFPKLFLSGDHDQYAPANQLRSVADSAREPKRLTLIENADHFFVGHLPAMQVALGQWLRATFLTAQDSDQDRAPDSDPDRPARESSSQ